MIPIGLVIRAAALVVTFASGAAVEHWRGSAALLRKDLAAAQERQEARDDADAVAEVFRLRARAYEAWKTSQAPKTTKFNRKIQHEIDSNREWADQPLPDSVRRAAESAAAELGAAEPGAAVPAVPDAAIADQW